MTAATAPTTEGQTPTPPTEAEAKPEGEAPKEEPKAEPLTIKDLKVPEGVELDPKAAEGFLALANETGLKGEAAQKFFDYGSSLLAEAQKASVDAFVKTNEKWADECRNDKEFGGTKLEESLAGIAKVLDNPKFADPGLREALLMTGAGNHPAVFRTFARLAAALSEGTSVVGQPAKVDRPGSLGEALYGKQQG